MQQGTINLKVIYIMFQTFYFFEKRANSPYEAGTGAWLSLPKKIECEHLSGPSRLIMIKGGGRGDNLHRKYFQRQEICYQVGKGNKTIRRIV